MLFLEDYSNAVYWRISAIFATIAALFSVAVVLWFLIFRAIPDMPDDTDSSEKLRFDTNTHTLKRYNLISELTYAFKHFPRMTVSGDSDLSIEQPGFLNRLAYFLFGSSSSSTSCNKFDGSENSVYGIYNE